MYLRVAAFSGSGVRFPAYAGAIMALSNANLLQSIETVLGTSGGAIASLALALNFSASEIETLALELDYEKLISDGAGILTEIKDLIQTGARFKAHHLLHRIEEFVQRKTGNPNTTFAELHARIKTDGFRNLVVTAINMNAANNPLTFFSYLRTPHIRLADAVFASACAPWYIEPHCFDFLMADGTHACHFVDGGVGMNDPITLYVNQHEKTDEMYGEIINFIISDRKSIMDHKTYRDFKPSLSHNTLEQLETLMMASEYLPLTDPKLASRTVFLPPCGIGAFDLKITETQKLDLLKKGQSATQLFVDRQEAQELAAMPLEFSLLSAPPPSPLTPLADNSALRRSGSTVALCEFPLSRDDDKIEKQPEPIPAAESRCVIL